MQFGNPARHSKSAQNQFKQRPHQTLSRKGSIWQHVVHLGSIQKSQCFLSRLLQPVARLLWTRQNSVSWKCRPNGRFIPQVGKHQDSD
ncbi:MAG: hypothetical protein DWI22_07635 [Planctomycetota bacterium]|nr:MAG: hypothetical protein DWI22_07635 [Planctomycetota bacterium]